MITTEELQAWREACEKATPGPWRWGDWRTTFGLLESQFRLHLECNKSHPGVDECVIREREDDCDLVLKVEDEIAPADAAFIALSRTALPRAIAEIERLGKVFEAAKAWRAKECFKTATPITPRCPCGTCALAAAIDAAIAEQEGK